MFRPSHLAVAVAALLFSSAASQSLVGDDLPASDRSEENPCATDCTHEISRPVCGTDGKTYSSRCELHRQQCGGSSVQLKHRGPCTTEESLCLVERNQAERKNRLQAQYIFVPECREDGGFKPVQCHKAMNYCWCVTEDGKPITGSSVDNKHPNCGKYSDKRRSSSRGKKEKKGCSKNDKEKFNENLLKMFRTDYNRVPQSSTPKAKDPTLLDPRESMSAIEWKFTELDRNKDNFLDRKELQGLKRMLKKIVKPKMCARSFTSSCDQNHDKRISSTEWSICLNNDPTESSEKEATQSNGKSTIRGDRPVWDKFTTLSVHVKPTDTNVEDTEEEIYDCPTERQNALESQRISGNQPFVPNCTQDGKFATVQCFKPTGYCWCVDQETGKTISAKWPINSKPDCNKKIMRDKQLKGCPDKKKAAFIDDLVEYILNDYISANTSLNAKNINFTPEIKVNSAKRKFNLLDSNSNQVIDKKEWKDFKNEIKKKKSMRKCGRNFLKYCDDNDDKKVTLGEWTLCLKLKGLNPLITYLHE